MIMHRYWCYGLSIKSAIQMPELLSGERGPIDVRIVYGEVKRLVAEDSGLGSFVIDEAPGVIRFWMDQVGGLEIRNGREMIIHPVPGAEEKGFRYLVSGIGLGFVLHQRGVPSLHASAVAIDGEAVAFVGWKGMGKSSTAAAFHAYGFPVVTDDVLPTHVQDGRVYVHPAFPHLKLFPESIQAAFNEDPEAVPRIDPRGSKRARSVETGFRGDVLPIRRIYTLDWVDGEGRQQVHAEPLSPSEACLELMRHSFALRMFGECAGTAVHLEQSAYLSKRVSVRRLRRPRDIQRLQDIVELVMSEVDRSPETVGSKKLVSAA